MPLFTVIIPCFNRASLVTATIESVFAQECADYEIIAVDDGSTDGTVDVLKCYGDRVKVLAQQNAGPGVARNLGIHHARGEYVAFLDSDDLWFPWTLSTYRRAIEEFERPAFVGGRITGFAREEELAGVRRSEFKSRRYDHFIASGTGAAEIPPTPTTAFRAEILRSAGGFSPRRMNYEDLDLWLRVGTAPGFVLVEAPLVCAVRAHTQNVSRNRALSDAGIEFLLDQEEAGMYPGLAALKWQRRQILTVMTRAGSVGCMQGGAYDFAWRLYRRCFFWNVRLGRLRYLIGVPLLRLRQLWNDLTGSRASRGQGAVG